MAEFAILMLVLFSVIEAWQSITGVIDAIGSVNGILFAVSIGAALVPAALVIFWSGTAIAIQLKRPVAMLHRHRRR